MQLFDNLHKRIPKANITRICDSLAAASAGIKLKDYGKARIYFYDQAQVVPASAPAPSEADLSRLEASVTTARRVLAGAKAEVGEAAAAAAALCREPTDSDLTTLLEESRKKASALQARAGKLLNGRPADPLRRECLEEAFNFYRGVWAARRLKVRGIADSIAEDLGKKTKVVMEMLGCEMDEDEGVSLPPPSNVGDDYPVWSAPLHTDNTFIQ